MGHTYTVALDDPRGQTRYRNDGVEGAAQAAREIAHNHRLRPNRRMWVAPGVVAHVDAATYEEYVVGAEGTVVCTNRRVGLPTDEVPPAPSGAATAAQRRARLAQIVEERHRLDNEAARIKEQAAMDREATNVGIGAAMTVELLDMVVPEHGRTSCSDHNLANGIRPGEPPRCNRCAMLQLMRNEWVGGVDELAIRLVIDHEPAQ